MAVTREPHLDPSDIKLLKVFMKVVECGGFAGAQAELNVSPSTISTQMTTLESRLGMRLCQRGRVGFQLTDKGRRVYAAAIRLFSAIENFRSDVGEVRGKLVGELHIGTVDSTITNPHARLRHAIARFSRRDHAVHIALHVAEPAMLERRLLDGKLHAGIAAYYHHVPGLHYVPIYTEDHSLYCGRAHPFFERAPDGLTREEVCEADYVIRGYMSHRHSAPVMGLNAAATAYDMEAIAVLVLSGAYLGHLPTHFAAHWLDREDMRPVLPEQFDFRSRFEVATRKGAGSLRVLDAFLDDLYAAHKADPDAAMPDELAAS